jgi:hypothetical protein
MAVYVDDVRQEFGRMIMCHMWADTLEELLAMADRIGVQRKWLQRAPKASWTHFDIALNKKTQAIRCGAIVTDFMGPTEFLSQRERQSGDPHRIARAQQRLDWVAQKRAKKATMAKKLG